MRLGENIGSVYSNGREIQRVFSKGKLVWEKNRIDYNTTPFTIVALADRVFIEPHYAYRMGSEGGFDTPETAAAFKYSINGGEWIEAYSGIYINKNDVVNIIGTDIWRCIITGLSDICGNIMSLMYGDDFNGQTIWPELPDHYALKGFFEKCDIRSAENLILPATVLNWTYSYMFNGCASLIYPPKILPATTFNTTYSYNGMFYGCINLKSAPKIMANTLSPYCCSRMFRGCTSLTTPPELPATNLDMYCYEEMFRDCIGLTSAPKLPARSLVSSSDGGDASGCYARMFRGCTSLTTPPELPATNLAQACYSEMFYGCTSLTSAPKLPARLNYNCYNNMFAGCTSLTTAPKLTSSYLYFACYPFMFKGCTNLNYVECYAQQLHGSASSYTECIEGWLDDVSPTGTFVCVRGIDGGKNPIEDYIPSTWTVEYLN